MTFTFWIFFALIFYTFFGYGILLYIIIRIKRIINPKLRVLYEFNNLPTCTLIVAAYNEEDFITQKIINTLNLHYPKDRLTIVFVTDGSTDQTPKKVAEYQGKIKHLHSSERKGKIHAVHRAILTVESEIIVFTDANTFLNEDALVKIGRHYADQQVGAVAGEKRVQIDESADATAAEGFYWKYESKLKQWDSELFSVVGAAGELFSIRTSLYQPVSPKSVLDDFMISMRIVESGKIIVYEPEAYALETASDNIKEELKRKIRIAAGGIQSVLWLRKLLNPFRYPILSFQYISHRVLRWTITPLLLIALIIINGAIVLEGKEILYELLLIGQILFYLMAFIGLLMESRKIRIKALFIPYYFCVMNYAVLAGLHRFFFSEQSVIWDKARRK